MKNESLTFKGRKHTEETKQKMRAAHVGHVHSEETKLKIKLSSIGRVVSKETRYKMSLARSGKPLSEAHRLKLSQVHTGLSSPMKGRRRVRYCPKGHDIVLVGRTKKNQCIACNRDNAWKIGKIPNEFGQPFTTVDYDRHFQIQEGRCKICKRHRSEFKKALTADHDHATNRFRSLLCDPCNRKVNDLTLEDAQKIVEYLIRYK